MNCEICGKDPDSYVLLPKRQENGNLNTIACVECSESSGMYCLKHRRPHLGFADETTACVPCIEDMVQEQGEKIAGQFTGRISSSEKRAQIERDIGKYLELLDLSMRSVSLAELSLALMVKETPQALNISRVIITYSQRMKMAPEEVIEKVALEGSGVILP